MTDDIREMLENLEESERLKGDHLRRKVQFFFMNSLDKFRAKRRFPFKFVLQILKVLFVTTQLFLFTEMRMSHVDFMEDTTTEWNDDRDAVQYPPAEGRYSVYDTNGILEHLQFIINSYYSIQSSSFAAFSYDTERNIQNPLVGLGYEFSEIPFIEISVDRIKNVTVYNNTYDFDVTPMHVQITLNLTKTEVTKIRNDSRAVAEIIQLRGLTFSQEDALLISKTILNFKLRTIHFSPHHGDQKPECYKIDVSIIFDNSHHTGQVHVTLTTSISYVRACNGRVVKGFGWNRDKLFVGICDVFLLLICLGSIFLCGRSLIRAYFLQKETENFFHNNFEIKMNYNDKLEFLNLWYVMIVINSILLIVGTICKMAIEFKDFDNSIFTITGLFLGIGSLLVFVGFLRYLAAFNKFNILILTIRLFIVNLFCFMGCTVILYFGFLLSGWVIIGPYSMKFRTLSESSATLFSLLNGDDMFATFYTIKDSNMTAWLFGTIYIYLFVFLFTYVVLSLCIAIILDAYEVVKDRYSGRIDLNRSYLHAFLDSFPVPEDLSSPEARASFSSEAVDQPSGGYQRLE